MAEKYLIDGYNVMYRLPQLRTLAMENFESARDALITKIAPFCTTTGAQVTIVFDGRGPHSEPVVPFSGAPGLKVEYSPEKITADTIIERTVYSSERRRDIIVVSGDQGIRNLCRGLGAMVMKPDNFWDGVDAAAKSSHASMENRLQRDVPYRVEDHLGQDAMTGLDKLKKELNKDGK